MGFIKRALRLPARRTSNEDKELVKHHRSKMPWKLAKKEADKTRKILGPGASPDEIVRATNDRLETSAAASEPVKEERELETEKEVDTPTLEPVNEERDLEDAEEEECLPGLTCGDIRSEFEIASPAPEPVEEPAEEELELKIEKEEEMDAPTPEPLERQVELEEEDEETGIPGLTWADIRRTNADTHTKLAALVACCQ